jgi:hypothetical protein
MRLELPSPWGGWCRVAQKANNVRETIAAIRASTDTPELKSTR